MLNITLQKLFSGDKWSWNESISEYPSNLYTLKFYLQIAGGTSVIVNSAANSTDNSYDVTKPASETTSLTAGNYLWHAKFTEIADTDNVITYASGNVYVYPNLTTSQDGRSAWMKIYDNLMSKYNDMIASGNVHTSVSINGRSVTLDRTQLLKEIHHAASNAGIDVSGIPGVNQTKRILTRF